MRNLRPRKKISPVSQAILYEMGDDNSIGDNLMDLDLNNDPVDPSMGSVERFGFLLNELETAHSRIEERIRQLEAVTARARQRQRWRQARNNTDSGNLSGELMVDFDGESHAVNANSNLGSLCLGRTSERGEGCKRDRSHLVAKVLEVDLEVNEVDKEGGSFFDCNICLELAREPVLTCCGHLFCWACFFQVSYIDSTSKECPVCKGEVSDSTVIPIYGTGGDDRVSGLESGMVIPPRPRARRVEIVRKQRVTRSLSHLPVSEALRRIRISLGVMDDQTQPPSASSVNSESQEVQNADAAESRRERFQQVSRVLSESAASLSSLSSALSNAERLVENLETVINNRFLRSNARASLTDAIHPNSSGEINSALVVSPSSQHEGDTGSLLQTLLRRHAGDASPSVGPSSSRRRSIMARIFDNDSRDSRESRRRRLN